MADRVPRAAAPGDPRSHITYLPLTGSALSGGCLLHCIAVHWLSLLFRMRKPQMLQRDSGGSSVLPTPWSSSNSSGGSPTPAASNQLIYFQYFTGTLTGSNPLISTLQKNSITVVGHRCERCEPRVDPQVSPSPGVGSKCESPYWDRSGRSASERLSRKPSGSIKSAGSPS